MSEELNTQAVADETDVSAKPDTKVESAREDADELDTLLAEFDDSKTGQPAKPQPDTKAGTEDDIKAARDDVLRARDEIRQSEFKRDMMATVNEVRGEMPADYFDDKFVQAWIDARAQEDPRLSQAWIDRHKNPQQFKRVVGALGRDFAKKYGKLPDKQATEDREAVTAAVRGASTKAPEAKAPDYAKMTDAEFAKAKEELGI